MKRAKFTIRKKLILMFVALALLLSAGIGTLAYTQSYRENAEQYARLAKNAAELAARQVDAAAVEGYLTNGADAGYVESAARLAPIKENLGLRFLYVFVPAQEPGVGIYIFDVALPGEDEGLIGRLGDRAPLDVYDVACTVMQSGQTAAEATVTRTAYGYLMSAYAPVLDAGGTARAVVGVDIDMNTVMRETRTQTLRLAGGTAGVILLFLCAFLFLVDRQIVRPINGLSHQMAAFDKAAENLELGRFTVHTGDEIEVMADSFNRMAEDIQQYVDNLRRVTAEKERIGAELGVAKRIQGSMLPSIFTFIPQRDEFDIFATMEPAKEVGGDFYDLYIIDNARLAFVVADVSGKGVPAALFMVIAKTLIKNHALLGATPAAVLEKVNAQLCENNEEDMFVTVFLGMIELATGKLTFANAGHNQPLLAHTDGAYEWFTERGGFVLAGMEGVRYRDHERQLLPGDRLFLYTDGVTEALDPTEALFSDARLIATLNATQGQGLDIHGLLGACKAAVDDFANGAMQADDITMMAIDWRGPTAGR